MSRFEKQLDYVREIDRLKSVKRRIWLLDSSRKETSAEHSWQLATMALVLEEYAEEDIDLLRVLTMVLIHDMVEIDAGDSFVYDEEELKDRDEREKKAAQRIFGRLPDEQAREYRKLWEEFEVTNSSYARFASALDRLQPLIQNSGTNWKSWRGHEISRDDVVRRNKKIKEGSGDLWGYAK